MLYGNLLLYGDYTRKRRLLSESEVSYPSLESVAYGGLTFCIEGCQTATEQGRSPGYRPHAFSKDCVKTQEASSSR